MTNIFKRACPGCKKQFSNELCYSENRRWFKFSKPIVFCPHCHIELKEAKKSLLSRICLAVVQTLAVIASVLYKTELSALWFVHLPIMLFIFLMPTLLFKYEPGERKYNQLNADNRKS